MWTFSILIIVLIFKINIIIIVIIRTGRRQRCLPASELLVKPRYPEGKNHHCHHCANEASSLLSGMWIRSSLASSPEARVLVNCWQGASRFNYNHCPRCRCRQHHRHCHSHHPRNRWWWCSKVSNDSACFSPATRGNVFARRPQTGKTLMIMIMIMMTMTMMMLTYNDQLLSAWWPDQKQTRRAAQQWFPQTAAPPRKDPQ